MNTYRYAFAIVSVVEDKGQVKLDLPFKIYSQNICVNGSNRYCYLTNDLKDKEVLLYFAYELADEAQVKAFKGYKGTDWKAISKDASVAKHWSTTKEIALAVTTQDKVDPMKQVVVKYSGEGKDDIIHPYQAEDKQGE